MLFNSWEFLVFFPVVTVLFFVLPPRYRLFHLLAASCYFYMSFVPAYILILFFIILTDYFMGLLIEGSAGRRRRLFLIISLAANLGVLCFFKYFNFFIENLNSLVYQFNGNRSTFSYLYLLLPIGLSFHTFQSIGYILEVYRGNYRAERNLGVYANYVLFYPQLLAGPIERPQHLLPQLYEVKQFDSERVITGLKIMLWGFVKKVVIADRLAIYVNEVYGNIPATGSINLLLVIFVFFPFQIYCDFSGYTSIARGAAKVMGFNLVENFRTPFLSVTLTEFWNRWHISLNTWFRDYLYRPLCRKLKRLHKLSIITSLLVTFFICGLWHGAGWNYIAFGLVQGFIISIEFLGGIKAQKIRRTWAGRMAGILFTYSLISLSLVFFREADFTQALTIFKKCFWEWNGTLVTSTQFLKFSFLLSFASIFSLVFFEKFFASRVLYRQRLTADIVFSTAMIILLIVFGIYNLTPFIYFQF